jgi:hypothetical protein
MAWSQGYIQPLRELRLNNILNTETLAVRVWQCQTPTTGDIIFEQFPELNRDEPSGD